MRPTTMRNALAVAVGLALCAPDRDMAGRACRRRPRRSNLRLT